VVVLVQDSDVEAAVAEVVGGRDARGACADDDDVVHGAGLLGRCRLGARCPVRPCGQDGIGSFAVLPPSSTMISPVKKDA
jgi:hypothetical protein